MGFGIGKRCSATHPGYAHYPRVGLQPILLSQDSRVLYTGLIASLRSVRPRLGHAPARLPVPQFERLQLPQLYDRCGVHGTGRDQVSWRRPLGSPVRRGHREDAQAPIADWAVRGVHDYLFCDARSWGRTVRCGLVRADRADEFGRSSLDRVPRQALQRRSASGLARGHWMIQA